MKRIGYLLEQDFQRLRDYYRRRISELDTQIQTTDQLALQQAAQQAFYLQRYVDDMTHFGWPALTQGLEHAFAQECGDRRILASLHDRAVRQLLSSLAGLQTLGENQYVIHAAVPYFRTLRGEWYAVDPAEVFLLLPTLTRPAAPEIAPVLEGAYRPSRTDRLFARWMSWPDGRADAASLLFFAEGRTTPSDYSRHAVQQIREILRVRPSFPEVERLHREDSHYLETLFRVAERIVAFVQPLRRQTRTPVYLLRDGLMFSEAHTALDLLQKKSTLHTEAMIGRKLLSAPDESERYWRMVVDALYAAWGERPNDFSAFSQAFMERLRTRERQDPQLAALFRRLSAYLKDCLPLGATAIVAVDTGLQGSVNMLVKYLLDEHAGVASPADIRMYVVGEWFRGVYRGRFATDYYPMMKDIEILSRSEHLYSYVPGSLEQGRLEVEMGDQAQQLRANIELIVLTIVCTLTTEAPV